MKMQRSVLASPCIPTKRACFSGAAPDPYNTAGLKVWNREGKVDGMTSKGHGCCMAAAWPPLLRHIVPKSLSRYQQDTFPGWVYAVVGFSPCTTLESFQGEGGIQACSCQRGWSI